ncbi:Oidioi.mRNA.OKI2018_I69.YSR.g17160.t1.cds [Oikopleura dioica]|uniref:Oidioi.mRNA.OKI2018_I69.YSR.g17160.t1.cds n=1 Tax=Oikopleura dioica TaxID=34765 RepID=A0ABN7SMK2_OIKDI|nr:Oidioi.mRNA.OKI2018_I69.YSR.g17160.t1.cds [Oikopleura dioica]
MIFYCWNCIIFIELQESSICPQCNADHSSPDTLIAIIEGNYQAPNENQQVNETEIVYADQATAIVEGNYQAPAENQQEIEREIIYEFEENPTLKGPIEFMKTEGEIDTCYICIEEIECM